MNQLTHIISYHIIISLYIKTLRDSFYLTTVEYIVPQYIILKKKKTCEILSNFFGHSPKVEEVEFVDFSYAKCTVSFEVHCMCINELWMIAKNIHV